MSTDNMQFEACTYKILRDIEDHNRHHRLCTDSTMILYSVIRKNMGMDYCKTCYQVINMHIGATSIARISHIGSEPLARGRILKHLKLILGYNPILYLNMVTCVGFNQRPKNNDLREGYILLNGYIMTRTYEGLPEECVELIDPPIPSKVYPVVQLEHHVVQPRIFSPNHVPLNFCTLQPATLPPLSAANIAAANATAINMANTAKTGTCRLLIKPPIAQLLTESTKRKSDQISTSTPKESSPLRGCCSLPKELCIKSRVGHSKIICNKRHIYNDLKLSYAKLDQIADKYERAAMLGLFTKAARYYSFTKCIPKEFMALEENHERWCEFSYLPNYRDKVLDADIVEKLIDPIIAFYKSDIQPYPQKYKQNISQYVFTLYNKNIGPHIYIPMLMTQKARHHLIMTKCNELMSDHIADKVAERQLLSDAMPVIEHTVDTDSTASTIAYSEMTYSDSDDEYPENDYDGEVNGEDNGEDNGEVNDGDVNANTNYIDTKDDEENQSSKKRAIESPNTMTD
jgi:hypothetical protein